MYVSVLMGRYSYIGGVVKDSGGKQKKASRRRRKTSVEVLEYIWKSNVLSVPRGLGEGRKLTSAFTEN